MPITRAGLMVFCSSIAPTQLGLDPKIYYTWNESDGKYRQIWTAEMNVDGTGWNATKRTSTFFDKFEPQVQVIDDTIYFVWRESDGAHFQIWTGLVNRDGTGWQASKRTTTPFDKHNPQLEVQGGKIYLTWHEARGRSIAEENSNAPLP